MRMVIQQCHEHGGLTGCLLRHAAFLIEPSALLDMDFQAMAQPLPEPTAIASHCAQVTSAAWPLV